MPFNTLVQTVYDLQDAIHKKQIMTLTYSSVTQGYSQKIFLPLYFQHHRGLFYVIGCSPENEEVVMLRLERIIDYQANTTFKDSAENLIQRYDLNKIYIIRLLNSLPEHYKLFNNTDQVTPDPNNNEHLIIKLEADNLFAVKQHLLQQGFSFQVLYPQSLRTNILDDLKAMQEVYAA